jgi:hypothetical protein
MAHGAIGTGLCRLPGFRSSRAQRTTAAGTGARDDRRPKARTTSLRQCGSRVPLLPQRSTREARTTSSVPSGELPETAWRGRFSVCSRTSSVRRIVKLRFFASRDRREHLGWLWLMHVRHERGLGHFLLRLRSDHRIGINMFRAKSERLLEALQERTLRVERQPTLRPCDRVPATELLASRALMP